LPVGISEVLNRRGRWVAGADPNEDTFSLFVGDVRKGLYGIEACKAVDCDGIGGERIFEACQLRVDQVGGGVKLGGVAYVAAFYIADYLQARA
jgi:hypothetical protein